MRDLLLSPYKRAVMNNVDRAYFVECLIAVALGKQWQLTSQNNWDWAAWDIESDDGVRLEVKQAAARQSWDGKAQTRKRNPRFDIAPRTGYWPRDGGQWVPADKNRRVAQIYVFAWHGENKAKLCDQRNTEQWLFYVVREEHLPPGQKSIGLTALQELVAPCRIGELRNTVADAAKGLSGDHADFT